MTPIRGKRSLLCYQWSNKTMELTNQTTINLTSNSELDTNTAPLFIGL